MAEKTMVEAVRDALSEEMRRDERVFVLGEDVGGGGVFRATDGLRDEFGEERCMDTPLAEAAIVGAAIGASINGLLPVAEIQFADFIHPAFDQIVSEAARLHYRSNGAWSCPITVRTPYGAGIHGGPYHSQSIEAFYAHVPGLKVICVASPYDAKGLLKSAIRDPNPVVFLEHKKAYRLFREEVPDDDYTIPIGAAETKREGLDMTLVTYGLMTRYSLEAAEEVQGD
ncbi:MAG: alpha-ketoacid dehydrogenase subunit beta, partial [Chloroflexi bacterium]|nr:alpha-ketoacid dehydrogenase subunit beta [Chloroflexota bacterium]